MKKIAQPMRGFTLIELMIVIVIIGILAAIAIPQFSQYVAKSKLTDGQSALADYHTRLEQFYQDNRNYGTAGSICGDANNNGSLTDAGDVALPTSRYFTFACTVSGTSNQAYTATATSNAGVGLGAAGDYVYTVNESNAKTTTKFAGTAIAPAKNCWATSAGTSC